MQADPSHSSKLSPDAPPFNFVSLQPSWHFILPLSVPVGGRLGSNISRAKGVQRWDWTSPIDGREGNERRGTGSSWLELSYRVSPATSTSYSQRHQIRRIPHPNPAPLSLTPSMPPSPIASTETSAPPTTSAPGRPATKPPRAAAGSGRSYGMNWPSRTPRRSPRRTTAVRYDSPPLTSTSTVQAPPRCSTNRPNESLPSRCSTKRPNESLPSRCSTKRPNEGVSKALSINVDTFEKQLKKLTFAHLLKALKNPRHSLTVIRIVEDVDGCNGPSITCFNQMKKPSTVTRSRTGRRRSSWTIKRFSSC